MTGKEYKLAQDLGAILQRAEPFMLERLEKLMIESPNFQQFSAREIIMLLRSLRDSGHLWDDYMVQQLKKVHEENGKGPGPVEKHIKDLESTVIECHTFIEAVRPQSSLQVRKGRILQKLRNFVRPQETRNDKRANDENSTR